MAAAYVSENRPLTNTEANRYRELATKIGYQNAAIAQEQRNVMYSRQALGNANIDLATLSARVAELQDQKTRLESQLADVNRALTEATRQDKILSTLNYEESKIENYKREEYPWIVEAARLEQRNDWDNWTEFDENGDPVGPVPNSFPYTKAYLAWNGISTDQLKPPYRVVLLTIKTHPKFGEFRQMLPRYLALVERLAAKEAAVVTAAAPPPPPPPSYNSLYGYSTAPASAPGGPKMAGTSSSVAAFMMYQSPGQMIYIKK